MSFWQTVFLSLFIAGSVGSIAAVAAAVSAETNRTGTQPISDFLQGREA